MKCHEAKTTIYLHLDGEANQKQQAKLFDHLKECSACRQEMAVAKRTHDVLSQHCTLESDVPVGFRDSIMSKINFEQPVPLPNKKRTKTLWSNRWGIGIAASILGVFFTYALSAGNLLTNMTANNSKENIGKPKTSITKNEINLAQAPVDVEQNKTLAIQKDVEAPQKEQTTETKTTTDNKSNKPPKAETPIQVPTKVAKIAQLTPDKGSVDLPKPLAITTLVYGEPQKAAIANNNTSNKQLLISEILSLPGRTQAVFRAGSKLNVVTINQVAKLWSVDTLQNVKAQELDTIEPKGQVFVRNGKLQSSDAIKVAVSQTGQLASLNSENEQLTLTIGNTSAILQGNILSDLTWTPDGKQVVYYLENNKLGHLESFDGNKRTQLTPDMQVQDITWTFVSSDKMLLNVLNNAPAIWELQLATAKLTPLTNNGGGKCITVNKKGDIAFTNTNGKIYVLLHDAPSDKKLIELTAQNAPIVNLTWQDDKTILYIISEQDQTQIWKARLP